MNLDLDLGNSFLKWRCGASRGRLPLAQLESAELEVPWQGLQPTRVRLASVTSDQHSAQIAAWVDTRWGLPLEAAQSSASCAGVTNSYADPTRMGVDRWLAMLAGYHRAAGGCCVVDCGSAITIDYVAADGRHLGGFILPGMRLMRVGLLGNTQRIRVEAELSADTAPGRSTEEGVQHGIHLVMAALAERVVRDCAELLGPAAPLWVTGGDGELFRGYAGIGTVVPDLVLDGLDFALPEVR